MAESVRIENVVIAFPHLWEPHTPPGTTQAKWGAEFILHPLQNAASIAALDAAFRKVVAEVGKADSLNYLKNPCQSGDALNASALTKGKKPRQELIGMRVIRASDSNYQPAVVDQNLIPIPKEQAANVFGGCIVNAYIDLYWSNNPTNPGCFAGLRGVQLVSNVGVQRLGGGAIPAEAMFQRVDAPSATFSSDTAWE